MEIIVLPYMAISFLIGWAVFSPFAQIENLQDWKFARVETSDLFAIFLPTSYLLATVALVTRIETLPWMVLSAIAIAILFLSFFGLVAGLFLLAKIDSASSGRRITLIGVIIPIGALLTFAWIALPLTAFAGSFWYAIPATLIVIPLTFLLRILSGWVCKSSRSSF